MKTITIKKSNLDNELNRLVTEVVYKECWKECKHSHTLRGVPGRRQPATDANDMLEMLNMFSMYRVDKTKCMDDLPLYSITVYSSGWVKLPDNQNLNHAACFAALEACGVKVEVV